MKTDEILLVKKAKEGDGRAFSKLYEKYSLDLYRFALYIVGNNEDAEDAVQEAVVSAWRNISQLKDDTLFKAWIFKILNNKCKSCLCKSFKSPDRLPIEEYMFLEDENSSSMVSCTELKEALNSLTPPDGQIILLSIIGGFKSYEIAQIYNMPPSTIRSRQKRAIEKLKAVLS